MTRQADCKRRVCARMTRTGESYAAARADHGNSRPQADLRVPAGTCVTSYLVYVDLTGYEWSCTLHKPDAPVIVKSTAAWRMLGTGAVLKCDEGRMRAGPRKWLTAFFEMVIAAAAVAVIVAPHWPWYVATQTPSGGDLVAPEGTATGLSGHVTLWAVTGLAAVQLVLLLARHVRSGRLRVRGDQVWLVCIALVVCFLVVADADFLPASWYFHLNIAGESAPYIWPRSHVFIADASITLSWSYGAAVAVAAALTLLIASIAAPGAPAAPAGERPEPAVRPLPSETATT